MNSNDLSTYVSSGDFARDISVLAPDAEIVNRAFELSQLERLLEGFDEPTHREVVALHALAAAQKLPKLISIGVWTVGYDLNDDLGDEFDDAFENPAHIAFARQCVALADSGGGLTYLLLRDGHVAALDLGMFYEWQSRRFSSVGEMCWTLLHADAAKRGTFPVEQFKDEIGARNLQGVAYTFEVPTDLLPEIDEIEDPPPWLA
jgi:hypothetical protein